MLFAIIYGFAYAGVMTSLLVATRALTPARNKATWMGIVLSFGWLGHAFGGFQGAFAYGLHRGLWSRLCSGIDRRRSQRRCRNPVGVTSVPVRPVA